MNLYTTISLKLIILVVFIKLTGLTNINFAHAVEPEEFNDTQLSLHNDKIVSNNNLSQSICDALLAHQPGKLTFAINRLTLEGGLTVSALDVKKTIKHANN